MVQRIRNASSQPWRTNVSRAVQRPRPSSRLHHWSTERGSPKTSWNQVGHRGKSFQYPSPLRPSSNCRSRLTGSPRSSCFCNDSKTMCLTNLDGRQSLQTVRQSSARGLPHRTASMQERASGPRPGRLHSLACRHASAPVASIKHTSLVLLPQELP